MKNGKKGDVYSMGKTLADFFPVKNRPEFMDKLIQEMLNKDPKKRPKAEEIQTKFRDGLAIYKNQ